MDLKFTQIHILDTELSFSYSYKLAYIGINLMLFGIAQVPEVMEYVSEKADLYELHKKVKSWERKVDIAEVRQLPV